MRLCETPLCGNPVEGRHRFCPSCKIVMQRVHAAKWRKENPEWVKDYNRAYYKNTTKPRRKAKREK